MLANHRSLSLFWPASQTFHGLMCDALNLPKVSTIIITLNQGDCLLWLKSQPVLWYLTSLRTTVPTYLPPSILLFMF